MSEGVNPTGTHDDCGCCSGVGRETPVDVLNRPGLPAIGYRVGDQPRFKSTMIAALTSARRPALSELDTRDDDDFSIALIDAWATVADVLAFYQERIANECYLRTATERRSILELARLIGYELRPGVAANADLAFTLETAAGAPDQVTIPAGTKVGSIPGPNELPQTFETLLDVVARPELSLLRPLLLQTQLVSSKMRYVVVDGLAPPVKQGDLLLINATKSELDPVLATVHLVTPDSASKTTVLQLDPKSAPEPQRYTPRTFPAALPIPAGTELDDSAVASYVLGRSWNAADLEAQASALGWSLDELAETVAKQLAAPAAPTPVGVYAFHTRAAIFGHNAPYYDSVPASLKVTVTLQDGNSTKTFGPAYPDSWEGRKLEQEDGADGENKDRAVSLDTVHPKIVAGSWAALVEGTAHAGYLVDTVRDVTQVDYTISAKVTQLGLRVPKRDKVFGTLTIRGTTAFAESEQLKLALVPIPDPVERDRILLDGFVLGLEASRKVVITGEIDGTQGVTASEIAALKEVRIEGGYVSLRLERALAHSYVRATVTINANVAPSTHGESKQEALGSGDGSQPYQRFPLRQPPLTYVGAATPSGVESTLSLFANAVRWHEVPSLYGRLPNEHVYITRLGDDGVTTVEFGDGTTGARLPTGVENVTAQYRKGIGLVGLVKSGQLTLLTTKPLGVKSVTNPLDAAGAADPEPREQARTNAPHTVLTLDRVVSARDYEDAARSFAGIAKALATRVAAANGARIALTVAGPNGASVDPGSELYVHLHDAIVSEGDVAGRFVLLNYRPVLFRLTASVKVDPDYLQADVLAAVEQALRDTFSFDARDFGQPVADSEVIAVMQSVAGVVAVDVGDLFRPPQPSGLKPRLWAATPGPGDTNPLGAELLTLDPRPLDLGTML